MSTNELLRLPKSIVWNGQIYVTPQIEELDTWYIDGLTTTPKGDYVEPEDPDGWLMLLGLI